MTARTCTSVLVIVDMQPRFKASCDANTIRGVSKAITEAVARKEPIIVLETFVACEPFTLSRTHQVLLDILEDKEKPAQWTLKLKESEDGSAAVLRALETLGIKSVQRYRICGVNTSQCVFETALNLSVMQPQSAIEVVAEAVNDSGDTPWHRYASVSSRIKVA